MTTAVSTQTLSGVSG